MNRYTIYCTEEQTKKALELGAELELLDTKEEYIHRMISNKSFEENYNTPYAKVINKSAYIIPTAEQMIGWLRSKGFRFKIEELSDTTVAYRATFGYWTKCGLSSNPKEATFAVIDAALEYLIKTKVE